MIATLLTLLASDATLMALLTGGVHSGVSVAFISRVLTPAAFDANKELLPCCLIKPTSSRPFGPFRRSSQDGVSLWLYQRSETGSTTIESARARVFALLHRTRLSGVAGWEMRHQTDTRGTYDPTLDASLIVTRYISYLQR